MRYLLIGIGGFLGAIARYLIGGWVYNLTGAQFPWGTLAVNLSGSFFLGFFFTVSTERFLVDPTLRAVVSIGFIGAYTTFSTLTLETMQLLENSSFLLAATNIFGSVAFGLLFVYLGTVVGRLI
jgi:CrcB protein